MNFEDAKENIQPLATGRNASVLACSLTSHSELQKQRDVLEAAIKNYEGNDPLESWYDYILWIEQSYPSGGNESGLKKVLLKCLKTFEMEKNYYQDRRMIRIFIKYIDTEENPCELYQELFNSGIGTMIADLYICWAYYYDLAGNFQKADSIFKKGLELRAQPYDELEQAHKHFGFTMSQRILHQDETSKAEFMTSMKERRNALTSLKPHKNKVGSIRTGCGVKSANPGKIRLNVETENPSTSFRSNIKVQVFEDQNKDPNFPEEPILAEEHHIPVVRNIIDSARKQENLIEPGPWTRGLKKKGHLFDNTQTHNHEMAFTILEDDKETETSEESKHIVGLPRHPDNYSKGIILPKNFVRKNYPQGIWKIQTVADNEIKANVIPQYNKILCYPKPDIEFCPEEVRGYKWFKKNCRNNKFTEMYKVYFKNEISVGCRLYKNFAQKNLPDKDVLKLSQFKHDLIPNSRLVVNINEIYSGIDTGTIREEKQFEEILFEKIKSGQRKIKFDGNETICVEEKMDETHCFTNIVGRESIFPSRKSMAPFSMDRRTIYKPMITTLEEQHNLQDCSEKSPIRNVISGQGPESRKSVITPNATWTPIKVNIEKHFESKTTNVDTDVVSSELVFPKIFKKVTASSNAESSNDSKEFMSGALQNVQIPNQVEEAYTSKLLTPPIVRNIVLPDENLSKQKIQVWSEEEDKNLVTSPISQEKQFKIFTDENKEEDKKMKSEAERKNSDNFEIYTDPDQSFKFKQPNPPIKNVLQPKISIPFFEDDLVDDIPKLSNPQGFEDDDTCSTQAFNLFIRAQSISTPIGKKTINSHLKDSNNENILCTEKNVLPINLNPVSESEQKNPASNSSNSSSNSANSANSPELAGSSQNSQERIHNSSPYFPEQQPYKQLSTIMEISETNTLATASTKSSVDTQASSVEEAENIIRQSESRKTLNDPFKSNKSNIDVKSIHKSSETDKKPILENTGLKNTQPTHNMKSFVDEHSSLTVCAESNVKQSEPKRTDIFKINKTNADEKSIHKNNEIRSNSILENTRSDQMQNLKKNVSLTRTESNIVISSKLALNFDSEETNEINKNESKRQSVIKIRKSSTITHSENNHKDAVIIDKKQQFVLNFSKKENLVSDMNFTKNQNMAPSKSNTESILKMNAASVKIDETEKFTQKTDDTTHHINMESIQIFEEKTETVPKFILKRQANFEEEPKTDLYNFFVKTPERSGPPIALPIPSNSVSKAGFEINDTITFSNLKELTLPKLPNTSKFLIKDSPVSKIAKFSFVKTHNDSIKETLKTSLQSFALPKLSFEEQLPTLPNLGDLTLPQISEKQIEKSFVNPLGNSRKLSFLQKTHQIVDENAAIEENTACSNQDHNTFQKEVSKMINFENISKSKSICNKSLNISSKYLNSSKPVHTFEDNVQTDAFGLHISSIKNSTFLPQKQDFQISEQILEKSLHIKQEFDENEKHVLQKKSLINKNNSNIQQLSENVNLDNTRERLSCKQMRSLAISDIKGSDNTTQENEKFANKNEDDLGKSIYLKHSFKTPTVAKHYWTDIQDDEYTDENFIHHRSINLDQTNVLINEKIMEADVNPFSTELTKAFLEKIGFSIYLSELETCELRGKLSVLNKGDEVKIKNNVFIVSKIIGEGGFGTIYSAKEKSSGKLYAMKQEKPANLWEYYICLELRSRINNVNILPGFVDVEYALIGNNASILVSQYSTYGSFITICNTYKRKTTKNLDEYIVMILTSQILAIMDHLHASEIIHADVKPDNFLLMSKLSWPINKLAVQLIDFGISIDMQLFPKNQTFMYSHTKDDYKCIEMMHGRPWTYQTDLYGLAGTIHVLLYGKYMDVEKNLASLWVPKQRIPRYLNKSIWEALFQNLLNIRDCNTMPNLQRLRTTIEQTLADKEKYVNEKVNEFNLCLEK